MDEEGSFKLRMLQRKEQTEGLEAKKRVPS